MSAALLHSQKIASAKALEFPLASIQAFPRLATVLRQWRQRSINGRLPAALDPLALPAGLLPYVMLFDVEGMSQRLRVRLGGSALCARFGGELRGLMVDEIYGVDDEAAIAACAARIIATRRPSLVSRQHMDSEGMPQSYIHLMLPMSSDGHKVDRLFTVIEPETVEVDALLRAA